MRIVRYLPALLLFLAAPACLANPLELSNTPLFTATNAPPANVLFLIDDSGSMDWNTVTDESDGVFHFACTASSDNAYHRRTLYSYTHDTGGNTFAYNSANGIRMPTDALVNSYNANTDGHGVAQNQGFWRAWNSDYNRLYYNPEIRYLPWRGTDDSGNSYTDAMPSAIRVNPFEASGTSYDLTVNQTHKSFIPCRVDSFADVTLYPARYYRWTDSDADAMVDPGDAHELIEIRSAGSCSTGASCPPTFTRGAERTDCDQIAAGSGDQCTATEELQNFANWFQYYRRREFTAKAAYTRVVDDASGVNMGLVTLHNNNNVQRELALMSVDSHRNSLLSALSGINSSGGTPLQQSLLEASEYLACEANDYFSNCPQAGADQGGMCQQHFLVAMTDGYYNNNSNFSLPGADNEDGNADTDFDGGPYADNYDNTLADIAMDFYEHDIAASLDDVLPVIPGVDEARHQHVNTYTVAFGVDGTLDGMPAAGVDGRSFWPDPEPNSTSAIPEKIDDLRHAAFNGRGLFLNARSPDQLVEALNSAIQSIGDRASSAASVALNSSSLNSGSHLYQARFDSGDWSGQLLAYPLADGSTQSACSSVGLGNLCPLSWDAGQVLKTQHWQNNREIITIDPDSRTTGIPFRWNSLSTMQQYALRRHPVSGQRESENQGRRRLDFVRGRDFPGDSSWRLRSSPLGDIVHSDPVFVGAPAFDYSYNDYDSFRTAHAGRRKVVFVGANDAMLHAFDAANGEELLAYIPGDRRITANLTQLSAPSYSTRHRYFVDGSPTVGDIYTGTNGSNWKTVLVGGLRNGGQTVFALDISDPSRFGENTAEDLVLWEFSDEDDADLGFTHSQPGIVRMADGRWAAVIGNGYNNSDNSGNETSVTVSDTGKGYLFILFMDGPGSDGNWDQGTDYIKIEVDSGAPDTPNGLATPAAVDIDNDGHIDLIYAGDLNGNLWRFEVDDADPANWAVSWNGNPLFVARDGGGNRQPITVRPDVAPHPSGIAQGLVVLFGTGRYLQPADNSTDSTQTQSFYGIWDSNLASHTLAARSNLVQQQIIMQVGTSGSGCTRGLACMRIVSDNDVQLEPGHDRGWYLDLVNTASNNTDNLGERVVSNPVLRAGRIVFSTLIPSGEICDFGGDGWLMELDFASGARPAIPALDINGDGNTSNADLITVTINGEQLQVAAAGKLSEVGIIPRPSILVVPGSGLEKKYTSGSTGEIGVLTETGFPEGRLSWREIH